MPPRRRNAASPPPAEPSRAASPPPDVPPEPQFPEPDSATPPISPRNLANLPALERDVYKLIYAEGSSGMWLQDLGRKLVSNVAPRKMRSLVDLGLLKEVQDVRHRRRKVYVAACFKPSDEISGGTWYHDGKLDTLVVHTARQRCLAQVEKLGAATADMIHDGIEKDGRGAMYAEDKIGDILRALVLDKELEEVESIGEGEFAAVESGTMCYHRVAGAARGQRGMMEGIPCGVCPRIYECSPEGVISVISPRTCVYYSKWLQTEDFYRR